MLPTTTPSLPTTTTATRKPIATTATKTNAGTWTVFCCFISPQILFSVIIGMYSKGMKPYTCRYTYMCVVKLV